MNCAMSNAKMPNRFAKVATSATLPLVMLTLSVNAGIKYWDNPAFRAFDVGDYAPGGGV